MGPATGNGATTRLAATTTSPDRPAQARLLARQEITGCPRRADAAFRTRFRPVGRRTTPGESHRVAGRTHRGARSTQRHTSSPNTPPARPDPGCPWRADGSADRATGQARTPSAMCPWTPRHRDLQRYKVTHNGTAKKRARIAENPQLADRFPRVWQVLGSNQRSAEPTVFQTSVLGGRVPATHGRRRLRPRTAAAGAVYVDRQPILLPLTCPSPWLGSA